jgi:hypothetical protein
MHFRLVEIVFLDFISTTETFAAFCGGCLSLFLLLLTYMGIQGTMSERMIKYYME